MVTHSLGKDSCDQRVILQYTMQDRPESSNQNLFVYTQTLLVSVYKNKHFMKYDYVSLDKLLPRYF